MPMMPSPSAASCASLRGALSVSLYVGQIYLISSYLSSLLRICTMDSDASYVLIPLPKNRNTKLWRYFGFRSDDGASIAKGHDKTVYCKIDKCTSAKIPYCGNTTNLVHHIQKNHPKENAEYLSSSSPAALQKITSFCRPAKVVTLDSARGREITSAVVGFIVEDLRPINVVTGRGFRKLMQATAPEYPLASASYYTGQISDRYALASINLQSLLSTAMNVAITCDMWTSQAKDAFVGLTLHYVNSSWELSSRYVDCIELPGILLWSPYVIFLPCGFFLLSSFFPRLISAATDWMSTIFLHMAWP